MSERVRLALGVFSACIGMVCCEQELTVLGLTFIGISLGMFLSLAD